MTNIKGSQKHQAIGIDLGICDGERINKYRYMYQVIQDMRDRKIWSTHFNLKLK